MKVFTTTQYETKIYGVAKCTFAKKGFSLTVKTKDAKTGEVSTDTYNFKSQTASLPEGLPENFALEEIKYAVVLTSDGSEINYIRPANLRAVNFKFKGLLTDKDGDYLVTLKSWNDNPEKQAKFKALMVVTSDDPDDLYAGLEYPVTLPFTDSYGRPHIRRSKNGVELQGNAEKSKPYCNFIDFLEATGISDEGTEDPDPASDDIQDWLAELERLALENNRIVVGCDTVDGYISAWGESIPDESKKKKKVVAKKVEVEEEDDEEEEEVVKAPAKKVAPKAEVEPAPKAGKTRRVPVDEDDED